jgi:dTDP-4-amino-4,6-dideoxygalactose transaminase
MPNNGKIPFLDLISLHEELEPELVAVFQKALRTAGFIGGPMVDEFEREFACYCNAAHCVGLSSGTDAVRFALMAAGVQPGDIVVTVPHTFIATTEAITQAGARPDFVDIDERTYCIDPAKLQEYFEQKCFLDRETGRLYHKELRAPVTAVIPVHIYGQTADMDPILELARRYNLIVIEDACQAHGAEYFSRAENRWRKAGSMGHAAAFSFYPGKNLGACGEAGAVTTNDEEIARKIRILRDHGQTQKYYHEVEGYNGRLDAIQAGILQAKLKHLPEWTEMRRSAASRYRELFCANVVDKITVPYESEWTRCAYHLFVVRVESRDEVMKHLASIGIGTGIHYPIPLHLQNAYAALGYKRGDYPVAEKVAAEILSLPMYPHLREDQQSRVVRELTKFVSAEGQSRMEPRIA